MAENSALDIAKKERDWYRVHKTSARLSHYGLELAALALSFLVTLAGILEWNLAGPAVAGAAVAVIAGLRGLFGSQESWIAFAAAEADVDRAIDYYNMNDAPYVGPDRDKRLVRQVHQIRSSETTAWKSRKSQSTQAETDEVAPVGGAGGSGGGDPPSNLGQ
jgi:Protein of unknown function (DUF4231)